MRRISRLAALSLLMWAAPKAWADDAPAMPAAPAASGTTAPAIAPSADERRRIVEMAPPTPPPPAPSDPSKAGSWTWRPAGGQAGPCDPCGTVCGIQPCSQHRDECGWPIDNCGCKYGRWDVTVEGAFTSISSPDGILGETLFVSGNQLDWQTTDYDSTFGGRGTISYRFEADSRLELRGTYYGNPNAKDRQSGFFAAQPGATGFGDVSRPVDASFRSEAEAWSVEFNWWKEISCEGRWRIDLGVGFRYVSLDETATVNFVTTGPGPFPVDNGFVTCRTQNDFFGGQLMAGVHNDVTDCFEFFGTLKAMFGSVKRTIDVNDLDIFAGGAHSANLNNDEFVFGLDTEVGMRWKLSRHFALTAAYNLFFLDNIQRAEDGFDFGVSNSGAVQAREAPDQLVIHSLFVGISLNF